MTGGIHSKREQVDLDPGRARLPPRWMTESDSSHLHWHDLLQGKMTVGYFVFAYHMKWNYLSVWICWNPFDPLLVEAKPLKGHRRGRIMLNHNNQYGSWDYALRTLILNLSRSGKYQCWCWPTWISMRLRTQITERQGTAMYYCLFIVETCCASAVTLSLTFAFSQDKCVDKLSHTARPPPTVIWCVHPLFSSLFVSFTSLFVYLFVLVVPERV